MKTKHNYAFISYNHHDIKMAKWLHKKLESYKLPTEIHNEFENSKYLRPVFRDQEDLNTGVLSDELRKHLERSKYLVVICSPNSAKSEWVSNEVRAFIEWGRLENIIPFIIDETPNSHEDTECFPFSIREYVRENPDKELLGISIKEVGREKAFVKVVSRMLSVSFDELWKRHERERRRQIIAWSTGLPIATLLLYYIAFPINMAIELQDEKHKLPIPENAVLTVEGAEYPLAKMDTTLILNNMPGYYRFQTIQVSFYASYYEKAESSERIGFGIKHYTKLKLKRDSTFAVFQGIVTDEKGNPVQGADVTIENYHTSTNLNGLFSLHFDTEEETITKPISIKKKGMKSINRIDECPSKNLRYIMHKN